jgi:hypothetical protein
MMIAIGMKLLTKLIDMILYLRLAVVFILLLSIVLSLIHVLMSKEEMQDSLIEESEYMSITEESFKRIGIAFLLLIFLTVHWTLFP